MAGDWIKIEKGLTDKPEVRRLARLLNVSRWEVVGRLLVVWSWADSHSCDGANMDLTGDDIDDIVGLNGFADGLRNVGWLDGEDGSLSIPNFDRHNGKSAKARALEREAKRLRRDSGPPESGRRTKCPTNVRQNDTQNVGLEKRREENNNIQQQQEEFTVNMESADVCCGCDFLDGFEATGLTVAENRQQLTPAATEQPQPPPESGNAQKPAQNTPLSLDKVNMPPEGQKAEIDGRGETARLNRFVEACLKVSHGWQAAAMSKAETGEAAKAWGEAKGRLKAVDLEVLGDFYKSGVECDKNGVKFWKPMKRFVFFRDFGEVLMSAWAWAKETRWRSRAERARMRAEKGRGAKEAHEGTWMTPELRAIFDEMKGGAIG